MRRRFVLFFMIIGFSSIGYTNPPDWVDKQVSQTHIRADSSAEASLIYSDTLISCRGKYIVSENKILYRIEKTGGLSFGKLVVYSNEDSKVASIKGWRFGSDGQLKETLERKNIEKRGDSDSFHDDSEIITAWFKNVELKDFVAFEYAQRRSVFSKDMVISMGSYAAIKYMKISIIGEAEVKILNDPQNKITQNGNSYIITEEPALKFENLAQHFRERIPLLGISFDSENNKDWDSFSHFYWSQTKDALSLSPEVKKELAPLISVSDSCQFIEETMKHVTNSINYVDIEFGLGGYIPRSCNFVHQKKYGDCKDMAYYATAILRQKSIRAWPALTRTRSAGKIFPEFPSDQFNHLIVLIELDDNCSRLKNLEIEGKAYLAADPTDRFSPLPLLGSHLENVAILPVKAKGADLVSLPLSSAHLHHIEYEIKMVFNADQSAEIELIESKTGHFAVSEKIFRENLSKEKEREFYQDWIQQLLPGSELSEHSIQSNDESVKTSLKFRAERVGLSVQEQLYLMPNLIDNVKKPFRRRKRTSGLDYSYPSIMTIKVNLKIDGTFQIQEIPSESEENNEFFSYVFKAKLKDQTVKLEKITQWNAAFIPATRYPEFRKLYKAYLKSVKAPVVLKQ